MKLHRLILIALFVGSAAAEITVEPAGLQVVWDDGGRAFGGFKTYNMSKGVSVALHLKSDSDSIIGLDEHDSSITIGGKNADMGFFSADHGISEDGKTAKVDFEADKAEAVDGKLEVKGTIVVVAANEVAEASTGLIEWQEGLEVVFPDDAKFPKFTVSKVGKPDWGDEQFAISLKCNEDFREPIRVRFIEEDGTEHEASGDGYSRMKMGKIVKMEFGYKTDKKFSKARMVIEYWKDAKKVDVPVELKLGL